MKALLLLLGLAFGQVGAKEAAEALRSSTLPTEAEYNKYAAQLNDELKTHIIANSTRNDAESMKKSGGFPNEEILKFLNTCTADDVFSLVLKYGNLQYVFDHNGTFPPGVMQQMDRVGPKCREEAKATFSAAEIAKTYSIFDHIGKNRPR